MDIHITNLYGLGGTATLAQGHVYSLARKLGYKEMGLGHYHVKPNFHNEMSHRLDGVIAPLRFGDMVIFQYPSWNGVNYDAYFVAKIKQYKDTKLIIFVQDFQMLMFNSGQDVLDWELIIFNSADLLILPSKAMHQTMIDLGVRADIPVIYQTVWDTPGMPCFTNHEKRRRLLFTGDYSRFPFLKEYHGITPIEQFSYEMPQRENDASFIWRGGYEPTVLMKELSKGGFGLVWCDDEYFDRYYSKNQPHKVGFDLAAGIPLIVRKGCAHEQFVVENGLGFAVGSLKEADDIVQNISDEAYEQLYRNVANIQTLLLNGTYTTSLLTDAVKTVLQGKCVKVEGLNSELNINVLSNEESLKYIKEHKCSVARFGDGEFDIVAGCSIPYQDYNETLAMELRNIISSSSTDKFLVCLPDVFKNRERYNRDCINFWNGHLKRYRQLYKDICVADWYGSTFLSRPYIDLEDKSSVKGYFEKLMGLWEGQDLLIVEGATSRSGVGNELFAGAGSIERIICPSRNAYTCIDLIENEIRKYGKDKLILLMLGPTAKVISSHLSGEGFWTIDLGHIDSEFEWYKMNATSKVKLSNKHTAEHNFDENIVFDDDEDYKNQIVSRIEMR